MQPVGREHPATHLLSHQREDVDVGRPASLGLLARDRVEAFDARGDRRGRTERRAGA